MHYPHIGIYYVVPIDSYDVLLAALILRLMSQKVLFAIPYSYQENTNMPTTRLKIQRQGKMAI